MRISTTPLPLLLLLAPLLASALSVQLADNTQGMDYAPGSLENVITVSSQLKKFEGRLQYTNLASNQVLRDCALPISAHTVKGVTFTDGSEGAIILGLEQGEGAKIVSALIVVGVGADNWCHEYVRGPSPGGLLYPATSNSIAFNHTDPSMFYVTSGDTQHGVVSVWVSTFQLKEHHALTLLNKRLALQFEDDRGFLGASVVSGGVDMYVVTAAGGGPSVCMLDISKVKAIIKPIVPEEGWSTGLVAVVDPERVLMNVLNPTGQSCLAYWYIFTNEWGKQQCSDNCKSLPMSALAVAGDVEVVVSQSLDGRFRGLITVSSVSTRECFQPFAYSESARFPAFVAEKGGVGVFYVSTEVRGDRASTLLYKSFQHEEL